MRVLNGSNSAPTIPAPFGQIVYRMPAIAAAGGPCTLNRAAMGAHVSTQGLTAKTFQLLSRLSG
jgi:hypothetical protein